MKDVVFWGKPQHHARDRAEKCQSPHFSLTESGGVAGHGHDPAVSLSIYSDAQPEDLRAAGAALFG
ncbi:hypothetical protein [Nocardia nepalensis]|uniref:hypothetical protein n=1 Tax=Nocardia nepalensis TaxID=3375448 RepID=UPI003B67C1A7